MHAHAGVVVGASLEGGRGRGMHVRTGDVGAHFAAREGWRHENEEEEVARVLQHRISRVIYTRHLRCRDYFRAREREMFVTRILVVSSFQLVFWLFSVGSQSGLRE